MRGKQRELIQKRYSENKAIRLIAKELELSEGAVKMSLRRIRLGLMRCIQHRLETAG